MVYKLNKNAHKGRWTDFDLKKALARLKEEVEELEYAMEGGNTIEVLLEAADCANFALIISSIILDHADGGSL
jgi:phosphoribosyl-ATP pyrophosphohydrolase